MRPAVDKAERRSDLLRAARKVFASHGYHDAKVDDIATQAGVAKGTFYLYFKDKRSIFVELVDAVFARIASAILRVDVAANVNEQVKHNIRAIVAVLMDEPETTQLLLSHAAGLDPDFHEKLIQFDTGVRTLLTESLIDGQKGGIVAAGDPHLYATFAIGALREILITSTRSTLVVDREAIVHSLFCFLEGGFLRVEPEVRTSAVTAAASVGAANLVAPVAAPQAAQASMVGVAAKAKRVSKR